MYVNSRAKSGRGKTRGFRRDREAAVKTEPELMALSCRDLSSALAVIVATFPTCVSLDCC